MNKSRIVLTLGAVAVLLLAVATSAYGAPPEKIEVCRVQGTYDFGDGLGSVPYGRVAWVTERNLTKGDFLLTWTTGTLPNGREVCKGERQFKFVFVTGGTYAGGLGGLSAADNQCNTLADGKLPGTYKAWLSTSTESAAGRFSHSTLPYVNRIYDGTEYGFRVIAQNWSDLIDGTLLARITQTQDGICFNSGCTAENVWTGTTFNGLSTGYDCNGWSDGTGASEGTHGSTGSTAGSWTDAGQDTCNTSKHLYCFEQ